MPFNHAHTGAHLSGQSMNINTFGQGKCGIGVAQAIQGAILSAAISPKVAAHHEIAKDVFHVADGLACWQSEDQLIRFGLNRSR